MIAGNSTDTSRRAPRLRELTILFSVILCAAYFGMRSPSFLSVESVRAMLLSAATDGLMAIGMTIVIVSGCFDLSIGSTVAASGMVSGLLMINHVPVPIAVTGGLTTGLLVGWINGMLVTRMKINPFITTLGTMSIVRGIVLVTLKGRELTGFPKGYYDIAWGELHLFGLGIPLPVVYLVIATILGDLLLRRLRYLRQVYFIGSNEEAANLTGFNVRTVRTFAFMLMGLLAAFAGIIACAKADNLDPNEGVGSELRVIAAVIIGGASLSGGRGTILGSFLGLMLMQVISTGLVFQAIPPEAQQIAVGAVLILAAIIDQAGGSWSRNAIAFLTTTRNKKMERLINVVLAAALAILLIWFFGFGPSTIRQPLRGASGNITLAAGSPEAVAAQRMENRKKQRYVMIAAATWGPYWLDSKNGLKDKAAELGVEADFEGPATVDASAQIDYIKKAIARKVDGIIMVPMGDSLTPAINEAMANGIPVVCADADAPSSNRYSFIGTGNYNAGYMGGELLAKEIGGKGEVALITVPGLDNLNKRVDGYRAALAKFPDIKVVAIGDDRGSPPIGQQQCRAILQAHPNLAGFGCVDAIGGQGAAVAVKEKGMIGKIKVIAMDRDAATLNNVKEGVIQATIVQRTYSMAYIALQLLYNLRNEDIKLINDWKKVGVNPLPPNVDTGSFPVTKANVESFFRDEGDAKPPK